MAQQVQPGSVIGDSFTITHHHHPAADRSAWSDNTSPYLSADQVRNFVSEQEAAYALEPHQLPDVAAVPDQLTLDDLDAAQAGQEAPLA